MTKLRERMPRKPSGLRGFSERTQECYVRSVRQLAQHYNKPPDQVTEEELRKYFLHIKNVKKWKRATVTIAICGILAILQTWTRDMRHHPHGHFIVPGGGISGDGKRWLPAQRDYLMPERALAKIFRSKFRDALKKTELFDQVPKEVWRRDWVVNIKSVGNGKSARKYLVQYIFKIAISNKRIVGFHDGKVRFRYQDNKGRWHTRTLPAEKFMSCPRGLLKSDTTASSVQENGPNWSLSKNCSPRWINGN